MLYTEKNRLFATILIIMASIATPGIANAVVGDMSVNPSPTNINSSPLWGNASSDDFSCNVVNVTTGKQAIKVDIISAEGTILSTSGPTVVTLNGGAFYQIQVGAAAIGANGGFARCRISIRNPANIRANLAILRSVAIGSNDTIATSEVR